MQKKKGWGTLSIVLFTLGLLFPIPIGRTFCLGEILLNAVGLKGTMVLGSGTVNILIFISELLFIAGFIIGRVFKNHFLAKTGRILCLAFAILLAIPLIFMGIMMVWTMTPKPGVN